MTEIKKRRKRGGRKVFNWNSGEQKKLADLPVNRNGISVEGEREPKQRNYPGSE